MSEMIGYEWEDHIWVRRFPILSSSPDPLE